MQSTGGFEALLQGPTAPAGHRRLKGLPLRRRATPDQQQRATEKGADRQQSVVVAEAAANSQPEEAAAASPNKEPAATETTAALRSDLSQPEEGTHTAQPTAGTSAFDVDSALQAHGSQHQLDHDPAIGSAPDGSNGNPSLQSQIADQQLTARSLETSAQQTPLAADDLHDGRVDRQAEEPVRHLDDQQDSAGIFIFASPWMFINGGLNVST